MISNATDSIHLARASRRQGRADHQHMRFECSASLDARTASPRYTSRTLRVTHPQPLTGVLVSIRLNKIWLRLRRTDL